MLLRSFFLSTGSVCSFKFKILRGGDFYLIQQPLRQKRYGGARLAHEPHKAVFLMILGEEAVSVKELAEDPLLLPAGAVLYVMRRGFGKGSIAAKAHVRFSRVRGGM